WHRGAAGVHEHEVHLAGLAETARSLNPLPLWERVKRANEVNEAGEGACLFANAAPSPGACSLSLRTRHPLPQGERESETAAFAEFTSRIPSPHYAPPAGRTRRPSRDDGRGP